MVKLKFLNYNTLFQLTSVWVERINFDNLYFKLNLCFLCKLLRPSAFLKRSFVKTALFMSVRKTSF